MGTAGRAHHDGLRGVSNTRGAPLHAPSDEHACAWTINNGTDLEMGSTTWSNHMAGAVRQGLVDKATVAHSAKRAFRVLFRAGRFDPLDKVEWSKITPDAINSTRHQRISYEAGLQSMILLKNEKGLLPLKKGSKIAVVGPMGVDQNLFSDYAGDQQCFKGGFSCVTTIAAAIAAANAGGTTTQTKGVDVNSKDTSDVSHALGLVKGADITVLVLGNDKSIEHEGHDRADTPLLGQQQDFALQVLGLGKPTVLVMSNGGALAIDPLLESAAAPAAIVEAFNPAMQTDALAAQLFGDENRWGKLPVTMYPHNFTSENPMTNYDMAKPPGRTYKYYTGTPLFPFGHGLSLTTFSLSCSPTSGSLPLSVACKVQNTGSRTGDEVVMAFHVAGKDVRAAAKHPVPLRALVNFDRVSVPAGGSAAVSFMLTQDDLSLIDENGKPRLYKGQHTIILSRGHGAEVSVSITV